MKTIYNVDYFIRKFEAIPEELWVSGSTGQPSGPRCAMGHCMDGHEVTDEMIKFCNLFTDHGRVGYVVNNGYDSTYQQPTPKQRILAALYDIYEKTYGRKYGEAVEPKENITVIYKTVVIDSAVKELQTSLTEN